MSLGDLELPSGFDGSTRLFPLPNVVLFPQVLLPLHIFEPRYRQLTADALKSDRLITMVLIEPGWEKQQPGNPPIASVACIGKIVADQMLPDGGYNLLLRGLKRVNLVRELDRGLPYRMAHVELIQESDKLSEAVEAGVMESIKELATFWLTHMGITHDQYSKLFESDFSVDTLADLLAYALPLPVTVKQSLLAEANVHQRVQLLVAYLDAYAPNRQKENSKGKKFPPDFSLN